MFSCKQQRHVERQDRAIGARQRAERGLLGEVRLRVAHTVGARRRPLVVRAEQGRARLDSPHARLRVSVRIQGTDRLSYGAYSEKLIDVLMRHLKFMYSLRFLYHLLTWDSTTSKPSQSFYCSTYAATIQHRQSTTLNNNSASRC